MGRYSIKDLEHISGIKAHTIRMWEKRYDLIIPKRTETNIRYYSEDDLRHLLNVAMLNQQGLKISLIAKMDRLEIKRRVADISMEAIKSEDCELDTFVAAMLEFNEVKFTTILSGYILKLGFENCVEKILFPLIERVYYLWRIGTIMASHKNFVYTLVRQKIAVAIENEIQFSGKNKNMRVIMFLPHKEIIEIELLFYNLLARKEGLEVIYLGPDVPIKELQVINDNKKADLFLTSFSSVSSAEVVSKQLVAYKKKFPDMPFFIVGKQLQDKDVVFPPGFEFVNSRNDFIKSIQLLEYSD